MGRSSNPTSATRRCWPTRCSARTAASARARRAMYRSPALRSPGPGGSSAIPRRRPGRPGPDRRRWCRVSRQQRERPPRGGVTLVGEVLGQTCGGNALDRLLCSDHVLQRVGCRLAATDPCAVDLVTAGQSRNVQVADAREPDRVPGATSDHLAERPEPAGGARLEQVIVEPGAPEIDLPPRGAERGREGRAHRPGAEHGHLAAHLHVSSHYAGTERRSTRRAAAPVAGAGPGRRGTASVDLVEQRVEPLHVPCLGLETPLDVRHRGRCRLDRGVPADAQGAEDARAQTGRLHGVGTDDDRTEHVRHDLAPEVAVGPTAEDHVLICRENSLTSCWRDSTLRPEVISCR